MIYTPSYRRDDEHSRAAHMEVTSPRGELLLLSRSLSSDYSVTKLFKSDLVQRRRNLFGTKKK